jgi:hypothetical protein
MFKHTQVFPLSLVSKGSHRQIISAHTKVCLRKIKYVNLISRLLFIASMSTHGKIVNTFKILVKKILTYRILSIDSPDTIRLHQDMIKRKALWRHVVTGSTNFGVELQSR